MLSFEPLYALVAKLVLEIQETPLLTPCSISIHGYTFFAKYAFILLAPISIFCQRAPSAGP